jgi:hypothetical protein
MKRKVFFFGLTGALLVMFLAGCPNPTSPDKSPSGPDTSVLEAGIAAAEAAKAGVLEGEQANIAPDMAYVSQEDMAAFTAAISAAKAVRDNSSATQEAVNDAVDTLATAVQTFTGRIKDDGTKDNGFEPDELTALIAAANAAKQGVVTSADGADINPSVYWVTSGVMNAFTTAITAAGGSGDLDGRYAALVAAINVFKAELRPGARAKTVTITGLSAYANGAEIQAGLFETKPIQGNPQVAGMGTVQNGSAIVSLSVRSSGSAWAGTGSWYVAFSDGDTAYVTKTTRSFSADNVTVALSECEKAEEGEPAGTVGHITGTISFTGYSGERPQVRIAAYYGEDDVDGRGSGYTVNADGSFSIPFTQEFLTALQSGSQSLYFYLRIGPGNNNYQKELESAITVTASQLSGGNLNIGSIGTVSLASVTLSGTITVTLNGQPVPWVNIVANTQQGGWVGNVNLTTPGANASWSMILPALESPTDISLSVYGYDANWDQQLFGRNNVTTLTGITNTDKTGIVINLGSIDTIALSGTVTFAGAPPASSQIRISARYGAGNNQPWINNGSSYSVTVSGATGTWTIPGDEAFLAALNSGSQTVAFRLSIVPEGSGSSITLSEITRTVSKDALAGIDLGSVNISLVTLSGSITVTNAGQPIPILYIDALNAGQNQIRETRLEPATATTQWTMTIPAQQGGAITFRVYGYDSTGGGANQLVNKTFAPAATASVTDQPISGIALDAGDVGVGRLSGVVSFTNLPSPPPYSIYLYARWYYGTNSSKSLGSGSRVPITNGAWAVQKDDEFLAALESGDQRVVFDLYMEINQGESGARVATVDTTVGKNNLSNFNLGTIALPTLIKLSGTFSGSYNGTMPPYVNITPRTESGQSFNGASINTSSGTAWAVYIPVQETAARINFGVGGHDGSNIVFEFDVSSERTASVSNQDVAGIVLDVGNVVPNTLRVNNPPWGSYTAYVTATSISQTNYPSISQSGNYAANGSGSGSNVPLLWDPPNSSAARWNVLIIASGVTKYSSWTTFINGVGAVDWSAMTEVTTAQQLPAPENFRVTTTTSNSISLAWNSVSGTGVSYKVYRSAGVSGPYTAFGTAINGTSVVVSALDPDTTYYFKVSAVASGGTEGEQSGYISGKTASDDPYLTITHVAGNTTVKITTATISAGTVFDDLTGVVATGQGDHPRLTWTTGGITGVYNVMLRMVNGPNTVKYQNGVSFTDGSGTVDWDTMVSSSGNNGGGDTLPGAKGKLTLTGFNEFNGKYVYSALATTSGKYLIGTNAVELMGADYVMTMVQINGGTAEVPLYTTNAAGTTVADIYVPYEGSEIIQTVSIIIVTDSDGKFTSSEAASFATNYAAIIGSNASNTDFTPSTSSGSITVSRSDAKTMDEITEAMAGGDYTILQTVKYMLITQ